MTPNEKLQYAVVGAFLNSSIPVEKVRSIANMYGLESTHFSNTALGTAFATAMNFESEDKTLLYHEIAKSLPGPECDKAMDNAPTLLIDCASHIRLLVAEYVRNRLDSIWLEAKKFFAGTDPTPKAYAAFFREQIDKAEPKATEGKRKGSMTAKEFLASYDPAEQERNRLFAGEQGEWFAKEGALVLTSTAGAGKSVLATQMALSWACGKPVFGITPARPLKIGIFQTEDDNATMYRNITDWKKAGKWSDADFDLATTNLVINATHGLMGDKFISLLAEAQREHKFDIVIINPLQGVCAGTDIAKNAELTKFLREGLDSVIKGQRPGCPPCGLLLVHHTNKPTLTPNGYGVGSPSFLEYAGAGGAEIANWMRAMLLVLEDTGKNARPGHYRIIATKKGEKLGWPKPVGESIKRPLKHIRHHDPEIDGGGKLMYWYEVDSEPSAAVPAEAPKTLEDDTASLAADLKQYPQTLTEARTYIVGKLGRKRGGMVFDILKGNPSDYGLMVKPTGHFTEKVIGAKEDVEKHISKLAGKRLQENAL